MRTMPKREHYLICVQGVAAATLESIGSAISTTAYSYWNFLHGVWIVCVRPGSFVEWANWVNGIVQAEQGRCLLLSLAEGTASHGLMPPEAWPWLKDHLRKHH